MVVAAYGAPAGDVRPQWGGFTGWGDGEPCPDGGRSLRSTCTGWWSPLARAHELRGQGILAPVPLSTLGPH